MFDITDLTFFRIVDKQVREAMQQVETGLLPVAKEALQESGLSLKQHPVEGYYGKTPELTQFFNHIRTLQLNSSDKVGASIRKLHDFYTNEVFGLGQAVRTAINSDGVWYPEESPVVISPMVDPLTVAVSKVARTPETVHKDLTVTNITKALEDIDLGTGLVGFGALVDKVNRLDGDDCRVYNPVATTLARETTVLSAYVPTMRCVSQYKVSPQVEAKGNEVINAYNALFCAFGLDVRIPNITSRNAASLKKDLPEINRCVRIFNLEIPGVPKEHYHWAVDSAQSQPSVVDFWNLEVVTTDMFKRSAEKYIPLSSVSMRR